MDTNPSQCSTQCGISISLSITWYRIRWRYVWVQLFSPAYLLHHLLWSRSCQRLEATDQQRSGRAAPAYSQYSPALNMQGQIAGATLLSQLFMCMNNCLVFCHYQLLASKLHYSHLPWPPLVPVTGVGKCKKSICPGILGTLWAFLESPPQCSTPHLMWKKINCNIYLAKNQQVSCISKNKWIICSVFLTLPLSLTYTQRANDLTFDIPNAAQSLP